MSIKSIFTQLRDETKILKELEAKTNSQKEKVTILRDKMITEMSIAGTSSFRGEGASISLLQKEIPIAKNWNDIYEYIHSNMAYDLFEKRLCSSAWKERKEDGIIIPGVDEFIRKSLRVTIK